MSQKSLKELLSSCDISSDLKISNIELNSKNIKPDGLFFALKGVNLDGAKFIPNAIENGAVAVVCSEESQINLPENSDILIIKVGDVYQTLVEALQKFYPNLPENILAVTGTNGKTSVAEFMRQMIEFTGRKAASIGTVGIKTSNMQQNLLKNKDNNFAGGSPQGGAQPMLREKIQLIEYSLTTPDIVSLYKNLAILKENGVNDIAIEASSIGIEQKRMAGLKISTGAFTNFTQDHLDYHGSMEKYFECKMLLYKDVLHQNSIDENKTILVQGDPRKAGQNECSVKNNFNQNGSIAVLNADIPEFGAIKKIALQNNHKVFSYGKNGIEAKLITDEALDNGQKITFEIIGKKYSGNILMFGEFQIANILCALLSVVAHYNLSEKEIAKIIQNLEKIIPAEGRMQKIATLKNGAKIFIDYAHSPDALLNVLENAEKMNHNHLHVLFGCGGDRDAKKRPIMGRIACELADFVIVTDDNPRTEDAANIRQEILAACDAKKALEIADRKKAIHEAISMLDENDILIIAGKGHEKYQIIGKEKFPFDEEEMVKKLLTVQ